MNLKKLTLGLVALVGFGLMITQSAFTAKDAVTLKYRYTGADASGTTNLANWQDISNQPNPAACSGDEIPCIVQFSDSEYDNMSDFLTSHNTPSSIALSGKVTAQKYEE